MISIWCKCWKSMENRITKCNISYKMTNFEDVTNDKKTERNLKWPYISNLQYRPLIDGNCGSGKTNALLSLINNEADIDKMYLQTKDARELKYQFLINKRKKLVLQHYDDPKAFIQYSNDMEGVYKNIEEYNTGNKPKILIAFDDMITDMISNKNLQLLNYLLEAED